MGDTGAVACMSSLPKTDVQPARREPLTLLIAALGGQGAA